MRFYEINLIDPDVLEMSNLNSVVEAFTRIELQGEMATTRVRHYNDTNRPCGPSQTVSL
jgi:hypothetical protein